MTPSADEPTSISERVEAIALMTRKETLTESENLALLECLKDIMGAQPMAGNATVEDALALVTMAREFFKGVSRRAEDLNPEMAEDNALVFFSGRMDLALGQAIHILENVAGQSSTRYAWGPERASH